MSQLYLKYSSYKFILQKYFTSLEKANIFLKQDWAHTRCGEQAGSLAAPSMPAAKEMDRESTLPGRMCLHCRCVALAGQVRISPPGTGLWGRGVVQALGRSQAAGQRHLTHVWVPSSTSPRDPGALSAFEYPTVFPIISFIYLFCPNPVPMNFSSM